MQLAMQQTILLLILSWCSNLFSSLPVSWALALQQPSSNNQVVPAKRPNHIQAAVIVPGFLTGANEFQALARTLTDDCGIPTVAVPMPNWHWLPCLGGRSMRPVLERIDVAVRHVAACNGDIDAMNNDMPPIAYSAADLWRDFWHNPGGIFKVGGSWEVDEYPVVEPAGRFPRREQESQSPSSQPTTSGTPTPAKIALIGHSAGGWIARIYLSSHSYGGRAYNGTDWVHSVVTLGTPHASAPGPAFAGIRWINQQESIEAESSKMKSSSSTSAESTVRRLAVGGTGFAGANGAP